MSEHLKPCPFCGENDPVALNIEHMAGTILHPAYRVICDNCGGASGWTDRGDHLEQWNRRAEPPANTPDAG